MTQVLSFKGYTPPARYDAKPWEVARVFEADTADGPTTLIDELNLIDFAPLDTDPAHPKRRYFSTSNATAGLWYSVVFVDGDGGESLPTDAAQFAGTAGRDLCDLRDVFRLVPGFDPDDSDNADILETCAHLITSESTSIMRETGREVVAIPGADPRTFDLTNRNCSRRSLPIGDAAAISQVELFDFNGTTSLGVIDPNLYVLLPRTRTTWEPIRRIWFPHRPTSTPTLLAPGRTLVLTGTWGFPEIPSDLRQACAKRVLLRYVADNANAGTRLADAIDDTFSIGALLQSARETVNGYSRAGFA